MFRRKNKEPEGPTSTRYEVQSYASLKGIVMDAQVYADGLKKLLNEGDDKGWRLLQVTGAGSSGAVMVVWDTQPNRG
jgi:phosphoglycolate phosphatase-like HAD superfamily hydrolase